MQSAALILIAALAFVGVAISDGWREAYSSCPPTIEIIRYLPSPEPQPIYPAPALMPVTGFTPATPEPEKTSVQPDDDSPSVSPSRPLPFPFRHRHHRRHWRRH